MCLNRVTERFSGNSRVVFTGYKVFCLHPLSLSERPIYTFECYRYRNSATVPTGKWLNVRSLWERAIRKFTGYDSEVVAATGEKYPAGFHIFLTQEDAMRWRVSTRPIVKVKYRGLLVKGEQDGLDVVVASEMFVPTPGKEI